MKQPVFDGIQVSFDCSSRQVPSTMNNRLISRPTISPGVCRSAVRAVYRSSVLSLPCAFSVSFFGLLLLQHSFIDEKSTCFSCLALQFCIYTVLSKNKEKVQKTCVFCTLKAQILISAWRTAVHDVLPSDRISYVPSYADRGSGSLQPSELRGTGRNQPAAEHERCRDGLHQPGR